MTVAIYLLPCSACVNWHAKNKTHFSTDVDEILVHVCIHWGGFDNVHGNITGEAVIPVFTPTFKYCSLFPICQRHSSIAYWLLSQLLFLSTVIKKKRKKPQTQKTKKNPQETEKVLCCHSCIENLENRTKGNWMLPFIW